MIGRAWLVTIIFVADTTKDLCLSFNQNLPQKSLILKAKREVVTVILIGTLLAATVFGVTITQHNFN